MLPIRGWLLVFVTLTVLAGCAGPAAVSPLRLPTRIPRTPTPTPTATPTRFPVSARDYYEEGIARQEAGDAEGAIQSFTWAIQRAPNFALAYVARGSVHLEQKEFHLALADANAALEVNSVNAAAYALRGETLRLSGSVRPAFHAFERAIELDPDLKAETFRSRWLVARAAGQTVHLLTLSSEYADAHRDDPLRYYYRGWAFVELDQGHIASKILIDGIESTPDPPALLWFALGQAYAAANAWSDAITALEAARRLVEVGDTSLILHSDQPVVTLFVALGLAYLGAGRCVDAETMLTYAIDVGAPASEYEAVLEQARTCRTPTPGATPYPTTTPG